MSPELAAAQIGSIAIFCQAAGAASFTAAAMALGVTPAAVSRSVARTEKRLGLQLFARSTRQLRLTDNGRLYYEQCRQALGQIEDVERVLSGNRAIPAGVLRISAPTTYGNLRLLPLLAQFKQKYPQIGLEVNISNQNVDFLAQGYDLAIRLGVPQDSRLVARRLEDAALGVYASPAYLARRGAPQSLQDLHAHDCIAFIRPSNGRPMRWLFRDAAQDLDFAFDAAARFSGDVLACVGYAAAGGGLFQTYDFIAASPQYRGLVEVLAAHRGRSRPFSIVYPHNRHLSARLRALVDTLTCELRALTQGVRGAAGAADGLP